MLYVEGPIFKGDRLKERWIFKEWYWLCFFGKYLYTTLIESLIYAKNAKEKK